jgi:hypothetical protein
MRGSELDIYDTENIKRIQNLQAIVNDPNKSSNTVKGMF